MEWMLLPYKRYFDFSGRSRRKEYWMFALLQVIVYAVAIALLFASGLSLDALQNPDSAATAFNPGPLFWLVAAVLGIWALATIIPGIAVVVRRLHDKDLSGWWYLGAILAGMIPLVGFLASIALFVFMCLDGTRGPNRFGPDPKDPTSASVFA